MTCDYYTHCHHQISATSDAYTHPTLPSPPLPVIITHLVVSARPDAHSPIVVYKVDKVVVGPFCGRVHPLGKEEDVNDDDDDDDDDDDHDDEDEEKEKGGRYGRCGGRGSDVSAGIVVGKKWIMN